MLSPVERISLAKRVSLYQDQLLSDEATDLLDYLTEDRGLTMETVLRFQLGGVVSPAESDNGSRGKIAIPYLTSAGPVALRFRKMPGQDGPKYYQPPGSKLSIFNVNQFNVPSRWLVVTEGEIDCMTAVQAGLPAVGLPGASSWRDHYSIIFAGYERVIICADNDDKGAGKAFAEKIAENVPAPAIFLMEEGHDVNSFVKEHGAEAFREYIKVKR